MGYYTKFYGFEVDTAASDPTSLEKWYADAERGKVCSPGDYDIPLNDPLDYYDSMKWYDWQKDCEKLSEDYPNLLFTLQGEGEESGDVWKAWFRNGKSHIVRPKIAFPKPDNIDELLPKIPEKDLRDAKIRVELEEAKRRVEELEDMLRS